MANAIDTQRINLAQYNPYAGAEWQGTREQRLAASIQGHDKDLEDAAREVARNEASLNNIERGNAIGAAVARDATRTTPYALNPLDQKYNTTYDPAANPFVAKLMGGLDPRVNAGLDRFAGDVGMIRSAAAGNGPSAAEALARSQLDAGTRQAQSIAAGARGGATGAALRAAINAGQQSNMQSTAQLAAMRANEQLSALGMLPGANAALNQAQLGAEGALTQRYGTGASAANAAEGNEIAGRQLGIQGMNVQAGVAQAAANDLEEQRRRALMAMTQMQNNTERQWENMTNNRSISQKGEITPKDWLAASLDVGGAASAALLPKGK